MGVNRKGKLLSFLLAAVLCYSQLVASAHFVEHLPQAPLQTTAGYVAHADSHAAGHTLAHKGNHKAAHAYFHRNDRFAISNRSEADVYSPKHGERSIADCSIYHVYSGLNGVVQARIDIACALFDHVQTAAVRAVPQQQSVAEYQPIRAPPNHS